MAFFERHHRADERLADRDFPLDHRRDDHDRQAGRLGADAPPCRDQRNGQQHHDCERSLVFDACDHERDRAACIRDSCKSFNRRLGDCIADFQILLHAAEQVA